MFICIEKGWTGFTEGEERAINTRLLGDGVSRPPAEIHVRITVEYVPEFVPRPVAAATGFIYTAVYDDQVRKPRVFKFRRDRLLSALRAARASIDD